MFEDLLRRLGIGELNRGVCCGDDVDGTGDVEIQSTNPATGHPLPPVCTASVADYERVVERADAGVSDLADGPAPAPRRGRPPNR